MIFSLFKQFRLVNLFMIVLTQYLIRYCIIFPAFETESIITGEFPSHLSNFHFLLLVLSTVLIAAGGYIINDLHDKETDAINKPGKNLIGKLISENTAKWVFILFSSTGICIGFFLALRIDKIILAGIQVFTSFSLWMYATQFKKGFLSGNLLIAFLSSLSLLIVGLFEPEFYRNFVYLIAYAGMAFLISLLREVIKDMEDLDGDKQINCDSIPIRFGIEKSKLVVYFLILLNIAFIFILLYNFFHDNTVLNFWFMMVMFLLPYLALIYLVSSAKQKEDFHYAGVFTKFIMLGGILTMIPFYYYFLR